jgi:hypothetical protein
MKDLSGAGCRTYSLLFAGLDPSVAGLVGTERMAVSFALFAFATPGAIAGDASDDMIVSSPYGIFHDATDA